MPGSIPTLLVNDTRSDCHHGCDAVIASIERLMEQHGLEGIAYWPAHKDWNESLEFDDALVRARLVIVNGEGTIHHDRPAGRKLLQIGARAKASGVPTALINTSWEANGPDLLAMLDDFTLVSARDTRSAESMGANGCNVSVVPDLSICTPSSKVVAARSGIGVTDNVDRFKALALDRCRRALGADGRTVSIAYPSEMGLGGYLRRGLSLREDLLAPERLIRLIAMRRAQWQVAKGPGLIDFLDRLGRLELLVSGRFHACTLALVSDTPFVAQASNTGKIAAMVCDAGLEPWRADPELNPDVLRQIAARGWSEAEKLARTTYLESAHQAADSLFADLAALA